MITVIEEKDTRGKQDVSISSKLTRLWESTRSSPQLQVDGSMKIITRTEGQKGTKG